MDRRFMKRLAGIAALVVLTASCGLKQGATDALKQEQQNGNASSLAGAGAAGGTGGVTTGGTTSNGGGIASGPAGAATTTGGSSTTGGTTTGSGPTTTGGGTGGSTPCGVPTGGNSTGVTAKSINIGLHAPLTGTGTPFPNNSFATGADTYFRQAGKTICGRAVHVEVKDDTYKPSGAHAVCEEMAQRDFIVVGGGGTDQIQACATDHVVDSTSTPYLSAGVTDNGMTGLANYFATSLTYQQQGGLVLRNAQQRGFAKPKAATTGKQWAIVTASTPNFAGARKGIESALSAAGITFEDIQVDQNSSSSQADATSLGQRLARDQYHVVFIDLAPGYYVFIAGGFYKSGIGPSDTMWVSPGVTFTEMTVAQYLCTASSNAIQGHAQVLAPFPGIDHATADFKKAYNNNYDDIEWALWGLSEVLYDMLQKASNNLTRQNFIASTFNASFKPSVYPPVVYGGKTHFGGTGAFVQQVDCSHAEPDQGSNAGTWITLDYPSYLKF